ncbi:hypothetical protein Angca_005662, partial [Angiostrongylus cantonensis]
MRGATSAFGFFVKTYYDEHRKKQPNENMMVTEISKQCKCSDKWQILSNDEKRRFYELPRKDAKRYRAKISS